MSIKKLANEVQSRLSAAAKINSYTRAVEELVYNSLDSDSTSIAVRVDIHESFIQVIDNGSGISKNDIYLVGQRHATSKFIDPSKAAQSVPSKYGFQGESLANIIDVSSHVKVTSRYNTDETWTKYFVKGSHRDSYVTTTRPSKGTTVEIKGFLYNLHIQKKEINDITEIQSIKKFLQQVSLERMDISMSFRDNSRNEIVFTVHKNRDIYQTLSSLFEIDKKDIQELQVEKNQYKIKGFVGKNYVSHISHKWIYLNGRFVKKNTIHDIVNENFMKSQPYNRKKLMEEALQDGDFNIREIPYYFIFISCPQSDYDICFNQEKTVIQFRDWSQIKLLIEKFVQFFNGNVKLKDISVKKAKDKNVGTTQEEARKIVEKILGNKNGIQMDKGVIGKTVRKRNKLQNNNYNLQRKDAIGGSNKNHKSKENFIAESWNLQNNINSCHKINSNRTKNNHKFSHAKMVREKLIKSAIKDKSSPYPDPMIKKFIDPTESVKQRCNHYSDNIKDLLNKNKSARERMKQANKREDNIIHRDEVRETVYAQKEKYPFICNEAKGIKGNSNKTSDIVPLSKTNKEYLRSYDLVQTILNTQKDVRCLENGDISPENTSNNCRRIERNDYSNKVTDVTNCKSGATLQFTELTFDSHKYFNHNSVSKINHRQKTTNNVYKFNIRKEITQSVCNTKFKHRILKKYSMKKNYEDTRRVNINTVPCLKKEKMLNIAARKPYNIDINYNRESDFMKNQNKYSNDRCNFKVTGNIQSTYTIVDSNVSLNFENYINLKDTVSECHEKSIAIENEEQFETFSHINVKESTRNHTNDLYSREISKEYESKILFTTYSGNLDAQMITNTYIEPLNVCEAVYNSDFNANTHIDNVNILDTTGSCKIICTNPISILEPSNEVNYYDIHDIDEKSHHFHNIDNSNLYSNIIRSQGKENNQNENTSKKETEINSKVNTTNDSNEQYTFESLDVYFKTSPDWSDNVVRNQNSNNFVIQNRHSFLPKGMSQIFENCNSKKVCSYDLEMDYFQDELYNEFANNVLDNFNLFETRIQNVKDYAPENFANLNKKLKNDSTSLKFNTYSLRSAKVFGQVDNKYIAAELHGGTDRTLKYLVLFDQHAVHERIKLEENLSDYIQDRRWISVDCGMLAMKLNKESIVYLNNYKDKFTQLGLKWTFENDYAMINSIPLAVLGKHCRQTDVILTCIKNLITEEIKAIKYLKGNSLLYPKSIMELVFSEACRYAIKFGDVLTKDKCSMLIESLSTCKTPFQCAHGRPVMAVLSDMKTINNEYAVNMSRVLIFRNKVMK